MSFLSRYLLICGLVCSWTAVPMCVSAAEVRPIPNDSKSYTSRQFDEQITKFYTRTIVEAYRRHGSHSSKWDASAVRFLEGYVDLLVHKPNAPTPADLCEEGKALVDLGCDDPMVLSCYGICLFVEFRKAEAAPFLEQSLAGFLSSSYPRARTALVPKYLLEIARKSSNVVKRNDDEYRRQCVDLYVESLCDGSYEDGEQIIAVDIFQQAFYSVFRRLWEELVDRLNKAPGIDPYIVKVISGIYHCDQAWDDRGGTVAELVTDEQWEGFRKHLKEARELLTGAWKLHPELPQAPQQMIRVAMAKEVDEEDPRLWFDRAIAAQFDYTPAYSSMLLAFRWNGSLEEMHQFGLRCLETERFDTRVPWFFWTVLDEMNQAMGRNGKPWQRALANGRLDTLLAEYEGKLSAEYEGDPAKTLKAATAWQCGEFQQARKLLEELGDKVCPEIFSSFFGQPYEFARYQAYMYGGPYADEVEAAGKLYGRGKLSEAKAAYLEILKKCEDDEDLARYLQRQIGSIDRYKEFVKGEWRHLVPPPGMDGWLEVGGKWSVSKDGTITGTTESPVRRASLMCNDSFGTRFEITGEIAFPTGAPRSWEGGVENAPKVVRDEGMNGGIVITGTGQDVSVLLQYDEHDIVLGVKSTLTILAGMPVKQQNTFRILYWDGEISVYLNDKLCVKQRRLQNDNEKGSWHSIGLCGTQWHKGVRVEFSNLRIRRLSDKPKLDIPAGEYDGGAGS